VSSGALRDQVTLSVFNTASVGELVGKLPTPTP
jgi:hypothetical protein